MSSNKLIKGTIIFTLAGIICRVFGFLFRVYISRILPSSEIGLYQQIMPLFILGQAICVGGLTTSLSKYTAAYLTEHKKDKIFYNFLACILFTVIGSILLSILLINFAPFIANKIICNDKTSKLIILITFSIPFSCVHSIICSYYIGLEMHHLAAISQVIEQFVRIVAIFFLINLFIVQGFKPDSSIAVFGNLAGEISATLFTVVSLFFLSSKHLFFYINKTLHHLSEIRTELIKNLRLATPLTANKICVHIIMSVEAILLPMMFVISGKTYDEALTIYGILTGMSLPLIMFPATLTNSMSQALLPDIAKSWQINDKSKLKKSISFSLTIAVNIGIMCIPGFYFYGARLGGIIFNRQEVISQIKYMCLFCPFIFLSTPLSCILNAIGQTQIVFISNLTAQLVKLAVIVFVVPKTGMDGLYLALFLGSAIPCIWQMFSLKKITGCKYSFKEFVLNPVILNILTFFITFPVYTMFHTHTRLPEALCLLIGGITFVLSTVVIFLLTHKELPGIHSS